MAEPTLYERLGGIFAIAAVVDNFSDRLLKNQRSSRRTPSCMNGTRRPTPRGCRASSG